MREKICDYLTLLCILTGLGLAVASMLIELAPWSFPLPSPYAWAATPMLVAAAVMMFLAWNMDWLFMSPAERRITKNLRPFLEKALGL